MILVKMKHLARPELFGAGHHGDTEGMMQINKSNIAFTIDCSLILSSYHECTRTNCNMLIYVYYCLHEKRNRDIFFHMCARQYVC